jgi:NAD(P)-dependent dehydrogenase (short-subunit alcohol dehydrogenase family)
MNTQDRGAVLVTGAATGLGKACALRLDREGYRVFAGVRDLRKAEAMRMEAGPRLMTVSLDITIAEHVRAAAQLVRDTLGQDRGLSGLINNAGIALSGPMEFFPLESLRRILEVNVIGQVSVIQAFLPLLRKSQGRVVNIGSGSGRLALPFIGGYAASKFALRALNDTLRRELRPSGIPVILVELGFTSTDIRDKGIAEAKTTLEDLPSEAKELYARPFSAGIEVMTKGFKQAMPAERAAEIICKALHAKNPKPYYAAGAHIRKRNVANFLPTRLVDRWVWRVLNKNL